MEFELCFCSFILILGFGVFRFIFVYEGTWVGGFGGGF